MAKQEQEQEFGDEVYILNDLFEKYITVFETLPFKTHVSMCS